MNTDQSTSKLMDYVCIMMSLLLLLDHLNVNNATVTGGQIGTFRMANSGSQSMITNVHGYDINGNGIELYDRDGAVVVTDCTVMSASTNNGTAVLVDNASTLFDCHIHR